MRPPLMFILLGSCEFTTGMFNLCITGCPFSGTYTPVMVSVALVSFNISGVTYSCRNENAVCPASIFLTSAVKTLLYKEKVLDKSEEASSASTVLLKLEAGLPLSVTSKADCNAKGKSVSLLYAINGDV